MTKKKSEKARKNHREPRNPRPIEPLPHVFFSINDLTKMFKISRSVIANAISRRKISYYQMGRRKLFDQGQVEDFADKIKEGQLKEGIVR